MFKPLTVNLPYPPIDGINIDKRSAIILCSAYAGSHGELNSILQYIYHYFYFKKLGKHDCANTIISIALAETMHLETLGQLLLQLGADPVYATNTPFSRDFYCTNKVIYSNQFEKMVMDDVTGELVAIDCYERILRLLKNQKVEAVIARIKLDEELHVKALKQILSEKQG